MINLAKCFTIVIHYCHYSINLTSVCFKLYENYATVLLYHYDYYYLFVDGFIRFMIIGYKFAH